MQVKTPRHAAAQITGGNGAGERHPHRRSKPRCRVHPGERRQPRCQIVKGEDVKVLEGVCLRARSSSWRLLLALRADRNP